MVRRQTRGRRRSIRRRRTQRQRGGVNLSRMLEISNAGSKYKGLTVGQCINDIYSSSMSSSSKQNKLANICGLSNDEINIIMKEGSTALSQQPNLKPTTVNNSTPIKNSSFTNSNFAKTLAGWKNLTKNKNVRLNGRQPKLNGMN
jgi:hypothetical protein